MIQSEVAGLVLTTKARVKAEEAGIDATVSVKTAALKKAEREGDTNTVQQLEAQLADIESEKEKRLKQMGKTAAKEYVTERKEAQLLDSAIAAAAPKQEPTKVVKTATQLCYALTAKAEGTFLDTDPKWIKALDGTERARLALANSLEMAAKRANNRAKELRGGK